MNSFALATQISWTLQSAIALTFAVALAGLALQLKRPGTSALALAWSFTTVGLVSVALESFIDSSGSRVLPTLLLGGLTLAGIGGSVPAFEAAVDVLTGTSPIDLRAVTRRALMWAGGGLLSAAVLVGLAHGPFGFVERFVGMMGRVLIVVVYVRLTFHVLARRRESDTPYAGVLATFAGALVLQALRPLLVLLLFRGGVTSDLPATLESPSAIAFVGFHVFAGTAFGVACVLMALAEERSAMLATGQQLRDAALRLERSHRLESIGRLASGVAHDFNNLLTVISSSAELARHAPQGSAHFVTELGEIEKAAARGAGLTQQLLAFARRQPQCVVIFDAGERLQQMSSLLERLVGRGITLDVIVHPQPAQVAMDPVRYEQVVLNLVANARDAIPDGGRITVTVGVVQLEHPRALPDGELCPGRFASVTVTDTGNGIAPDVLENLFEPFFTTRHDEGGTGLGLATVQGIVRQAGGDVSVESVYGAGSTFTVLLPAPLTNGTLPTTVSSSGDRMC